MGESIKEEKTVTSENSAGTVSGQKGKHYYRALAANGAGILTAFGIAFGGLFLVQNSLAREAEDLLQSGGMVEVPVQAGTMISWEAHGTESVQVQLTEEELKQVVERLEKGADAYPHEPWQGQLSMAEAMECGRDWTESFLLPYLGMEDYRLWEYSANCYLWAWQEDVESGERNPIFSYWKVWLDTQGLAVDLTLNAVTGQVLSANVALGGLVPVEYQDRRRIMELLSAYGDSFGLEGKYFMADEASDDNIYGTWRLLQAIGEDGIYAVVKTNSIAVTTASENGDYGESVDIFNIDLRLQTQ